jgi:UDP-glucose:(heptosyl)LPS alpha-1,3-glucosyltransferase
MNGATMPQPPDPVKPRPPQRILFVRQRFSQFGGGELILDRMIDAMLARKIQVALLGRAWSGRNDIEFIRCDPPRFPRFRRERQFADAACRQLSGMASVLVQSHERIRCCDIFRAGDGLHAAFLAHRARYMSKAMRALLHAHPFHRSVVALEREMFASPRLKTVLANSQMVADEIVQFYGYPRERVHLAPNGIDLVRFHPDAREHFRAKMRSRFGSDRARPVALFVGSGFKRKGLGIAIGALAQSRSDAELWVIGHDRRPATYQAMAERAGIGPRLRMIGPVRDPLPYYAASDLLILPTIYDPFPSAVLEALACGLPVVTSTGCGAAELVARLDPGFVREADDVAGFADALARAFQLATNPATAQSARMIAEDYGIEPMIDRLFAIYQELAV